MEYTQGSLVEYDDNGTPRLGIVLEVGRSFKVLADDGAIGQVSSKRINWGPIAIGAPADEAGARVRLRAFVTDLDAMIARGDLAELWELLREEGELTDLDGMAELLFGELTGMSRLAARRLLRADRVFFKERKDGFEPRSSDQVEALTVQRDREQAAAAATRRARSAIIDAAVLPDPAARRDALAPQLADLAVRGLVDLLVELAAAGDEAPRLNEATTALAELEALIKAAPGGVVFQGTTQRRAFELLVRVGHFSVWENLHFRRFQIRPTFDESLEALAAEVCAALPFLGVHRLEDLPDHDGEWDREDLTALPTITIDAESTRDLDDGLSLETTANGFRLGIHIADPASIVAVGDPLDAEALRRGTSVYAPGRTVPMFPRALSESGMSLVAGEIRPAMSFLVELDAALEIVDWRATVCWVKVAERMSYEQVDAILAGELAHPLAEMLRGLDRIGESLRARRLRQGAVVMGFPEAAIKVEGPRDASGTLIELECIEPVPYERIVSRLLVGEMMILVGELMGRYAQRHSLPVIYRTQAPPPLAEDEARLAGRELDLVESFDLRRFMQRGETRTSPGRHFGLGLEVYVQATSPIRRYGDLVHHRQLHAHLRGHTLPYDPDTLVRVAGQVDSLASEAAVIQREDERFWKLVWLSRHLGEVFECTVAAFVRDRTDRAIVVIDVLALTTVVALIQDAIPGDRIHVRIETVKPRRDQLNVKMVTPDEVDPSAEPSP